VHSAMRLGVARL